jgi:hypothetical protein
MLHVMPDEERPEPEHVVLDTGKVYKEAEVHPGPAPMGWPPADDEDASE